MYSHPARMWEVGRRWRQLVQGGLGPAFRYSAWLNRQDRAGRERKRGKDWGPRRLAHAPPTSPLAAGWVARLPAVPKEAFFLSFFFCAVRIGGSCRCLRPSAHPRARLYRISQPAPPSLPPLPQSLAHTARASTSCVRSAGGVQRFFVFAFFVFLFFLSEPRRAYRRPARGRENFCVSCQAKELFIATKKIPVKRASLCVCACVCK